MINAPLVELLKSDFKDQFEAHRKFNEKSLVRIIRSVNRIITTAITDRLVVCGYEDLTSRHLSVFENLDFEGTNIVTLAARAGISKQAMSKLVKEVAQGDYIKVVTNRNDTRAQIVYLTPKGIHLLNNIRQQINEYNMHFCNIQNISNEDAAITFQTLSKLFDFVSDKDNVAAILN
jgi:DNA-binding MarR family transcriptional regulator